MSWVTDISSDSPPLTEDRPVCPVWPLSRSEKKPLESISAAKESAMEWEEIMEEGMENTPVSWDRESASLRAIRELAMESGLGL